MRRTKADLEIENEHLRRTLELERKDNHHWREHAHASLSELRICQREKKELQLSLLDAAHEMESAAERIAYVHTILSRELKYSACKARQLANRDG